MPYREDEIAVVSSMQFAERDNPTAGGELALRADHRVQFVPSPALRKDLDRLVDAVDSVSLKWGTSLIVGLAAVGAGLFLRGRRGAAYGLFGASAVTGAAAYAARGYAHTLAPWLLSPLPLDQVRIARHAASGGIRVVLDAGGLRKMVALISPSDFDPVEGDNFLRAISRARSGEEE
jgi:hypothetical protein